MNIKQWQIDVDDWIKSYGVRYFDIKTNNLLLVEEVGELTRLIARKYGEQSFKQPTSDDEVSGQIERELADILFVATCLANQMEIDLTDALKKNLAAKTSRDATRHISNDKLRRKHT